MPSSTTSPPGQQLAHRPAYRGWAWAGAEKEYGALPAEARVELDAAIERLLAGESRAKDVKAVGRGLRELRCRLRNNQYRILFAVDAGTCVGLAAFYKNQERLEKRDVDRARRRMALLRAA